MVEAKAFFLPHSLADTAESDFAELAQLADRPVPEPEHRIYSITYSHNGEEWTATVGEKLQGIRRRTVRSGGSSFEQKTQIADPAVVLAIFPGSPYIVVTDHRLVRDVGSRLENPFMAGQPTLIRRFLP